MENNEEIKEQKDEADNFINEIQKLKETTVPKEDYDKIVEQNKKFKDALIHGVSVNEAKQLKTKDEALSAYVEAIKKGVSKLDGIKASLEERDASIRETGVDPYMDQIKMQQDPNFGERTAAILQDLVEKSNGDPNAFDAYFKATLK